MSPFSKNVLITKDIVLDIQVGNPTLPIILMGDFNIVLEIRDNKSRNADNNDMSRGDTTHRGDTTYQFIALPAWPY